MTVTAISYANFQRRYIGKFIARERDGKIRASGDTYRALLQNIHKRRLNRNTLIVGYVPPKKAICIYSVWQDWVSEDISRAAWPRLAVVRFP